MIIQRYITREVMMTLSVIVGVLLLAFLSQQTVRYLNYVAVGKIPTNVLLQLVSFEVPYLLALLLPLGLFLAIMLTYGRMQADHEMAVLQMSGFGARHIFMLSMWIASIVSMGVLILMLWINPWVSTKRQAVMQSDEATLHLIQTLIPGRFQVSPDGKHVMYVEKLSLDRERAQNVFLAEEKRSKENPDQSQWMLVVADEGYQTMDKKTEDPYFVTVNGYRYEGVPGQNDYKIIRYKKYAVRLLQGDPRATHNESETLPSSKLLSDYRNPNYAAELQWRISMGIVTFILGLFAIPLSLLRPRQGRYMMLLPAIIVYIVYMNLLFVARHWIEQSEIPISFGMWWVHAIVLIVFASLLIINQRRFSGFRSP